MEAKLKHVYFLLGLCIILVTTVVYQYTYYTSKCSDCDILNTAPMSEQRRKEIADYISNNIGKIVSEEPMNGGSWVTSRIEFLNNKYVIVHYEDGHTADYLIMEFHESDNLLHYSIFRESAQSGHITNRKS